MEINCPQCDQRLRIPDGLRNPLLRCKNCSSKFRLAEAQSNRFTQPLVENSGRWQPSQSPVPTATANTWAPSSPFTVPPVNAQPAYETPEPVIEVVEEDIIPPIERRPPTLSEKARSFASSSIGTIVLVLIVILFKGGPRFAKHFLRDRQQHQQQAQPMPFNENELDELRKMNHRVKQRMAEAQEKLKQQEFQLPQN